MSKALMSKARRSKAKTTRQGADETPPRVRTRVLRKNGSGRTDTRGGTPSRTSARFGAQTANEDEESEEEELRRTLLPMNVDLPPSSVSTTDSTHAPSLDWEMSRLRENKTKDTKSPFGLQGTAISEDQYVPLRNVTRPDRISTFIIYTPDGQSDPGGVTSLRVEDWRVLEKLGGGEGGTMTSIHSPDDATAWVESHYDHQLLVSMRSSGLGGPIATMLSPNIPALAVFGDIGDSAVLKAAKLLSNLSQFTVMIRPLADDPIAKWAQAAAAPQNEDPSVSHNMPDIVVEDIEPTMNIDQRTDTRSNSTNDEALDAAENESEYCADDIVEDVTGAENSADSGHDSGVGIYRLRGGAGSNEFSYTPWLGPVHDVDAMLDIQPGTDAAYKATLRSKTQFTVQSKYADKARNGYRPQVISWTRFMVSSNRFQVYPDRSYSNIGFLVHGQHISECTWIDCGFSPPNQIRKVTDTQARGNTWMASINPGPHPSGSLGYSRNNTKSRAVETLHDRTTPKCPVYHDNGGSWVEGENHYESFNVSYEAMEDPVDPRAGQPPMEVEFSMGINIINPEDRDNPALPTISFIGRNQTMLWIANSGLKAKGQGIIVLTCSYVPDVQTEDALAIVEKQVVLDTKQLAAGGMLSAQGKGRDGSKSSFSILAGVMDHSSKPKTNMLKQLVNKFVPKSTPELQLVDLPLYEIKARGWDATLNKWRLPVYPMLDADFRQVTEGSKSVWMVTTGGGEMDASEPTAGPSSKPQVEPDASDLKNSSLGSSAKDSLFPPSPNLPPSSYTSVENPSLDVPIKSG